MEKFLIGKGFNYHSTVPQVGTPRNFWFVHETFAPTCDTACCFQDHPDFGFRKDHHCMRDCC